MRTILLVLLVSLFLSISPAAQAEPLVERSIPAQKIAKLRELCRLSAGMCVVDNQSIVVHHRSDCYELTFSDESENVYVIGTVVPRLVRLTGRDCVIEEPLDERDVDQLIKALGAIPITVQLMPEGPQEPRFNSKGTLVQAKPPSDWRVKRTSPRRLKPIASATEFTAWFLDSEGGQKDLVTNDVPGDVRGLATSLVSDYQGGSPNEGMSIGGKHVFWWPHFVGIGDRYDSVTTGPHGSRLENVYIYLYDALSTRCYRIVVEWKEDVCVIDTLRSGEQLVRWVRRGSRAWQETNYPKLAPQSVRPNWQEEFRKGSAEHDPHLIVPGPLPTPEPHP